MSISLLWCCLQVDGQLQLFAQQLLPHSQGASQACLAAISAGQTYPASASSSAPVHYVTLSMLRCYKLPEVSTGESHTRFTFTAMILPDAHKQKGKCL